AQTGGTQPTDPKESRLGAEIRLERDDLAEDCSSVKNFASCAATLATDHPFHVSLGSIAPQNGFGAGPAVVTHFTPTNWRLTWSGDAVFAPAGAWRAGTYLKLLRSKIEPPQLGGPGERARPLRITEYPVYNVYAQANSLPKLTFYGIGSDTSIADKTAYGMSETILGGNAAIPLSTVAPLKLSLLLEANGRLFDIRGATADDVPSIKTRFTEVTAPGVTTHPAFAQFGEGVRLRPWLFNDRLQFGYTFLYQQFASSDSSFSFRRWTIDLNHQVPLYHTGGGPALRDERNTPNECSVSPLVDACPSVTRDLWGSISVRVLVSKSQVGDSGVVPFYLQRTLGGSDIDGQRALASYDDYRFRGPHLMLFQETVEHALWGPIGALVLLEQGKVAAQGEALSFSGLQHSVGIGATLRAGGFPAVAASWHTGGPEGRHFIFTIDTSLLGGGGRPALQ
ncbi:MAG: hypothetical protein DMG04_26225, partial [Acidobacteria bacterium]